MRHDTLHRAHRRAAALLLTVLLAGLPAGLGGVDPKTAQRIDAEIEKVRSEVIKVRRFIHMNPELGNREFETSRLVASKLEPLGLEVRTGVAKTGIVAVLRGSQPGPAVAVRADMDALPIQETTNLPYKSLNPGIMHACGHDVHTSIVLGTALVLNSLRDRIKGTVTFLFQPAEEGAPEGEEGGAELMVREGALDNPPVGSIFGFHVWPESVGTVLFAPGAVTASADDFAITVLGKSAHGARPHEGVDAVVVAAEIVTALQSIVSRTQDPTDPAVLTVGTITGGARANIIAEKVVLEGTVRTLSETTRKRIPALMEAIVRNIAEMHGASHRFEYKRGVPSVFNNPELTAAMAPTLVKLLGKDKALEWKPQMIAEDFSFFGQKVPGLYFFLGVKSPAQAVAAPLHSPNFSPDERSIPLGIKVLCHLLLDALDAQGAMTSGSPRT
ncbi:MAG: amidohydrolase [Candidatus Aminicenantes bacterium]|nr:amidohydrolase [Candidatus Aminicenantes bacterium]